MADLGILDSIDGALADYRLSADAMRWVPEDERPGDPRLSAWRDSDAADALRYSLSAYVSIGHPWMPVPTLAEMAELHRWALERACLPPVPLDLYPAPVRHLTLPHPVKVSVTIPLDEHHADVAAEFLRAHGIPDQPQAAAGLSTVHVPPPALSLPELVRLARELPQPRCIELHCQADVIEALKRQMPMPAADRDRINVSRIAGIEIFASEDMRPGEWELREHGEAIHCGRIRTAAAEEQAARELTALTEELGLYDEDGGR